MKTSKENLELIKSFNEGKITSTSGIVRMFKTLSKDKVKLPSGLKRVKEELKEIGVL